MSACRALTKKDVILKKLTKGRPLGYALRQVGERNPRWQSFDSVKYFRKGDPLKTFFFFVDRKIACSIFIKIEQVFSFTENKKTPVNW